MAFLIDTSVWSRERQSPVMSRLYSIAMRDELWSCSAVDLEMLYNARAGDVEETAHLRRIMLQAPITAKVLERSLEVTVAMANAGLHRHAKPMDLVIAAAAEASALTVLHYDRDFDRIASVTGQPTEWVAPAGSLDSWSDATLHL